LCTNLGASSSKAVQVGSFINENDKRHNYTVHRHDHANSRNISFSFNPETLIFTTCPGEHRVLRRTLEGMDVGMDNPPLFVLTDQNFPPMVPAEGEGECLKIIQVENGSLADLVEVFLGVTRGFQCPCWGGCPDSLCEPCSGCQDCRLRVGLYEGLWFAPGSLRGIGHGPAQCSLSLGWH
jgi:hypothetical protein